MEGSIDKNQSYFFLFYKEEYTMEQVRTFTLEECYQHCNNEEDKNHWHLHFEPEEYEVVLNDGRKCFIQNDPYCMEWGGIEFEDETTINFEDIPTELLDELVQKTPLIRKVTLEQFEDDWYQQKAGCVAIRRIQNN